MNVQPMISYSREEKIQQFLMLLKDPDVQPVFKMYVENIIATSELQILKRLSTVESALGLNDFADFEDEQEMSIPEQISLLSERIDIMTEGSVVPIVEEMKEPECIPVSKTEVRAVELIKHLKSTPERNKEVFMNSREIMDFLKFGIKEEYQISSNVKNPRQVKKDVIQKAVDMYPDCVFLSKKKTGNREVRIVFRPNINSNGLKCK